MPRSRKHHTGLSRLLPYAAERKGRLALIALLAALSAAAPVVGWHLVQDAINNGIEKDDEHHLLLAVIGYIGVNAAAWVLGTLTWLGLADVGQRIVLELRRDLFSASDLALAALLLAAEGGLDHLAADERHRRALGRAQPGLDDARRQHADADRRGRRAVPARRAARARGALRASRPGSWSRAGSSASRTRPRQRCGPGSRS